MSIKPRTYTLGLLIFTLATLFYGYEYILRVTPAVMSGSLMAFFQIDATGLGLLSGCYFYAYTPMQLIVGVIVDRYNLRYILVLSILLCALGCALMGMSDMLWLAVIGRFMQGLGSAFAFVSALKIAAIWLPENRFAWYTGINNTVGFLFAGIFGEVALNRLLMVISWQMVFFVLAGIGVLLGLGLWVLMRHESNNRTTSSDNTPTFQQSVTYFLRIVKVPSIWLSGLIAALLFLPTSVFASLWGIPYLEKLHHYSSNEAAFANSMIFVGWALGASVVGYVSDRLGQRALLIRLGSLIAFGLACVLLYVKALNYVSVSVLFVVFGMASSVEILTFVLARDYSPHKHAIGTAIAFVNMLSMVGGLVFQGGLGKLLDLHLAGRVHHGIHYYSLNDFQHAIIIIPLSLLLAFICSWWLKDC